MIVRFRRDPDDGTRFDAIQWFGDNAELDEFAPDVWYAEDGRPVVEMAGLHLPVGSGEWILRDQNGDYGTLPELPRTLVIVEEAADGS